MKIDYLEQGSPECPLVRIFDFERSELEELQLKCFELSQGRGHKKHLAGPHQNCSADDCSILCYIDDHERGLLRTKVEGLFILCLTNGGWLAAAEKLQPLLDEQQGFQWLSEQGEIRLLISRTGAW